MKLGKISLKYKVMVLLSVMPMIFLGSYLLIVINVFKKDKIAYIYDSSSSVNRSIASQTKGVFLSIIQSVKPIIQDRLSQGSFLKNSTELFNDLEDVLSISQLNISQNHIQLGDHLSKNPEEFETLKNTLALEEISKDIISNFLPHDTTAEPAKEYFRTPFSNNNGMIILKYYIDKTKEVHFFAITFKSLELASLFSKNPHQKYFLTTQDGQILYQSSLSKPTSPLIPVLSSLFFSQIKSKKINEGTDLLKLNNESYLTSYNRAGFSDLVVITLINEKESLSAIKELVAKSILFGGILLCVALIVSIIGSEKLTSALRELSRATQKISKGEFGTIIKVTSADEVGELAQKFNLMSQEIKRLMSETAEKARMENELNTAKTVQETLFPPHFSRYENFSVAGHYEPASECGGDWWYYTKLENKLILFIGDATGHGAPAALITSAARSAASVIQSMEIEVSEVMSLLNRAIYDVSKGQLMMTFFIGIIDLQTNQMTYSNASHESPYLVRGKNTISSKKDLIPLLSVNNERLGHKKDTRYDQDSIQLEPHDFMFFYTDGIADIRNSEGQSLGERQFIKTVIKTMEYRSNPETFVKTLNSNLSEFRQLSSLPDDVTYFCVRYDGAA